VEFPYFQFHGFLWLAWLIYWWVAGSNTKDTARRDDAPSRVLYLLPLILAGACFWLPGKHPALRVTVFPDRELCAIVGTGLLILGMFISCWARVALGRNWSNVVTIKVDHELIQSGPYRWVRHPIYTGLVLAISGSALAQDFWIDLVPPTLIFLAFWFKLAREEKWMRTQFGDAYADYSRHTARLFPYVF
jgi:protein-S-isoprenylcysteine O-methyltransferase Ste14